MVVLPRVRGWFDRGEFIGAILTGDRTADTGEVRIDWCRVLIAFVNVATGSIGLPDFDELIPDWTAIAIDDLATDFDAFTNGFAVMLDGQIRFQNVYVAVTKSWGVQLNGLRSVWCKSLVG